MKKLSRFLLFAIILGSFLSLTINEAGAQNKYILYVTYKLPTHPDLVSDASNLESECTNKHAVCMQACQIGDGKADCQNRCQLAFRQCLLGIKGVKFWLAACKEGDCNTVTVIIPLTRDEVLDIRLNAEFNEIKPGYYKLTGTYASVSSGSCTFRRTSDNVEISFNGSGIIGQAISNYHKAPGKPALYAAIENGQYTLTESLLSRGADVNEKAWLIIYNTPIGLAAKMGKWDLVKKMVLKFNGDVNKHQGATILQSAIMKADIDLVKFVVEHGADINDKGKIGNASSPLSYTNNFLIAEYLISQGANVNGVDFGGNSCLASNVAAGDLPMIKILLKNGADINAKNISGETPLAIAIKNKRLSIVKLLISFGATGLKNFDYAGLAVAYDDVEILKYLISQGVDVNNRKNPFNTKYSLSEIGIYYQLPLVIAAENGNLAIIKILLQHGANINEISPFADEKKTALDYAEEKNHKEVAAYLRSKGAINH